jgi:PD-(D/E)XK nuclease superfamily
MTQELVFPPRWHPVPPAHLDGEKRTGPFLVSVNELNSFQRCRRAWDITSPSRQSLHRKGMPAPALNIGSAVHFAMACQALGTDPVSAVLVFYQNVTDQLQKDYREAIGTGLSDAEWEVLQDQRDMVIGMVRAYTARYGKFRPTRPYDIVAPEVTFQVPLVPDYDIHLVGTIDRVHIDPDDNPVVGEIKTYKTAPKKIGWRFNHQVYGYAAALQILTGEKVRLALYDGIRKKAPTEPKVLKNGTLSTAWIDTTHAVYRAKLLEVYGGDKSILSHPAYANLLQRLWNRDHSSDSAFHTRFRVPISQHALELWWDQAIDIATEMAFSPKIYPCFDWQGCPMCKIRDLCHVIQAGEDETQIRSEFAKGLTHTRQAKKVATPENIRSFADLVDFAGSMDPDKPFDISTEAESDLS